MSTAKEAPKQKRKKTDWPAVERDYRASSLSLGELGKKHDCLPSAIANMVKRHGWERDLSDAVKHATKARLIANSVADVVKEGAANAGQAVTDAVLASAEVNVRIITSQRKRLTDLYALVERAQAKLETLGEEMESVRDAAVFVQAVSNLTNSTKVLIEAERKSFGLDAAEEKDDKPTAEDFIEAFRGQG